MPALKDIENDRKGVIKPAKPSMFVMQNVCLPNIGIKDGSGKLYFVEYFPLRHDTPIRILALEDETLCTYMEIFKNFFPLSVGSMRPTAGYSLLANNLIVTE